MQKASELDFESNEAQEYVCNYYTSRLNDAYKQINYVYSQKHKKHIVIAVINDNNDFTDSKYIETEKKKIAYKVL